MYVVMSNVAVVSVVIVKLLVLIKLLRDVSVMVVIAANYNLCILK